MNLCFLALVVALPVPAARFGGMEPSDRGASGVGAASQSALLEYSSKRGRQPAECCRRHEMGPLD